MYPSGSKEQLVLRTPWPLADHTKATLTIQKDTNFVVSPTHPAPSTSRQHPRGFPTGSHLPPAEERRCRFPACFVSAFDLLPSLPRCVPLSCPHGPAHSAGRGSHRRARTHGLSTGGEPSTHTRTQNAHANRFRRKSRPRPDSSRADSHPPALVRSALPATDLHPAAPCPTLPVMRRHHLSKLGFNTGSPFAPAPRMNAQEWAATFGGKYSTATPAGRTAASVPLSRADSGAARRGGAARSSSTSISPVRRRGEGLSGPLDAGRLAAARSTYDRVSSAPQRSPVPRSPATPTAATATAASSSAAAAWSPVSPAAPNSAPTSRRTSSIKRSRDDEDAVAEESIEATQRNSDDEEDADAGRVKRESSKRRKVKLESAVAAAATPSAVDRSSSLPPPLETAAGTILVNGAAAPPSSPASLYALGTPLSELVPQPSTPVAQPAAPIDVREKSKQMLNDVLTKAQNQTVAEEAAASEKPNDEAPPAAAAAGSSSVASSAALPLPPAAILHLADQIEGYLFVASGRVADSSYRLKLRDLMFNLRGNTPLCMRVLRGTLSPGELVQLDYQSLASSAVAQEREALRVANFEASVYRPAARIDAQGVYRCESCGSEQCSTLVIREERDISKADTWGSKQGAGSVIEIRCEQCKHVWTKEE